MLFVEQKFILFFLPLVILAYVLTPSRQKFLTLLVASIVFYVSWQWRFSLLLLLAIVVNYGVCSLIQRTTGRAARLSLFWLGIVCNLSPLAFFKYGKFILLNLGLAAEAEDFTTNFGLALPLAISFYTFQQITYLRAIYRRESEHTSFLKYCFVVFFFPHLIAGPILRPAEFAPQIEQAPALYKSLFCYGLLYFLLGFVKKVFVADPCGEIADMYFKADAPRNLESSLIAIFSYSFQIYFDFSGYSDMAIGLGMMFGYVLPINFYSPYKATSIVEFWRRWHITLSSFLRDFIYIPLGGNRLGALRQQGNLLATMLIGGLWHGASWTFVAWGGLHGLLLVLAHYWSSSRLPANRFLGWGLTIVAVFLLWVLFRAETFGIAIDIYAGLTKIPDSLSLGGQWAALAPAAILIFAPNTHQLVNAARAAVNKFGAERAIARSAPGFIAAFGFCGVAYSAALLLFYAANLDRWAYQFAPIARNGVGLRADTGDLRSQVFSDAQLHIADVEKVVLVGSSFVQYTGRWAFHSGGRRYESDTLAFPGNGLINGVRVGLAMADYAKVNTVVLGVSPLVLGTTTPYGSFSGECRYGLEKISQLIPSPSERDCNSDNFGLPTAYTIFFGPDSSRLQFRNFVYTLANGLFAPQVQEAANSIDLSVDEIARTRALVEGRGSPPVSDKNGENDSFGWLTREVPASLAKGGVSYRMLELLKKRLDEKGVKLVIYDTPTPSHAEAPLIYPEGFLRDYDLAIRKALKELDIPYLDLKPLFPWENAFFADFIHLKLEARHTVHRTVLNTIFNKEFDIKDVCNRCEYAQP